MSSNSSSSKDTESREELERQHDDCKDGNHKWEEERLTICTVCGMYQDEYNDRNKSSSDIK